MSTQIRFRLSGEEEQQFLTAARHAGLSPDAFARVRALAPIEPGNAVSGELEKRLEALGETLEKLGTGKQALPQGPASVINGIEVSDLVVEIRREVRIGFNAILALLDGDLIPDITNSQLPPSQRN